MAVRELLLPRAADAGSDRLGQRLAASAACCHSVADLERLLAGLRARRVLTVDQVPLDQLAAWSFEDETGDLVHDSGRFFAVRGIHVRTDYGHVHGWSQPILHQPEGGILGFLTREIDGILHFLVQLKVEPGNLTGVQVAPTVQATPSNYLRAHRGAAVPYLEHFANGERVLVDVLQSEQGSWFFGKRNRNMVVEVSHDIDHDDGFAWLTLGQIYALLRRPNVVNMDSRAVLSCLPLASGGEWLDAAELDNEEPPPRSPGARRRRDVRSWLTDRKAQYELTTTLVPLRSVAGWHRSCDDIHHSSGNYFRILGVSVRGASREVPTWCQPLLQPCGEGLVAFIVRRIGDILYVLARADIRPGYRDTVEIGPTVQCTPGNFAGRPEQLPEYLDLVLSGDVTVRYDVAQSEEGGRFHHAVTRHLIVEVDDRFPLATPPDFCWMTPAQLEVLLRSSYQVNIEARSLLVCLQALHQPTSN
jgi:oxidase EvaA